MTPSSLAPNTCYQDGLRYCTIANVKFEVVLRPLLASPRGSAVGVPATRVPTALLKARNGREWSSILVRTSRLIGSVSVVRSAGVVRPARVLRLRAHGESGAVGPRSPGWGVKAAVTLVRVLLREAAVAVVVSGALAAAVLGFRKGLLVGFDGPADDGGDAETADDDAEDDADGGHGVGTLGLAVVDVPGKDGEAVGRAGVEVGCSVCAFEAGARTAVTHDPGRHGHVEAVRRGHVGST